MVVGSVHLLKGTAEGRTVTTGLPESGCRASSVEHRAFRQIRYNGAGAMTVRVYG